jgi:hypothetical protein
LEQSRGGRIREIDFEQRFILTGIGFLVASDANQANLGSYGVGERPNRDESNGVNETAVHFNVPSMDGGLKSIVASKKVAIRADYYSELVYQASIKLGISSENCFAPRQVLN